MKIRSASFDGRHVAIAALHLLLITACSMPSQRPPQGGTSQPNFAVAPIAPGHATALPTRTTFKPGQPVDYSAQSGDTIAALAARFNTTVAEIYEANAQVPRDATTMPVGLPMKMPIYYRALWASPFKILPDNAYINGPAGIGFNTAAFVAAHPGWLKTYRTYAGAQWRSGADVVDYVAANYSVSPRLLLAILEYQGGALTKSQPPVKKNLLGFTRPYYDTPYLQLVLAGNALNNGYYGWRDGRQVEFEDKAGVIIRPDPWANAGSVAIEYYFAQIFSGDKYSHAVSADGLSKTYLDLFGDAWTDTSALMPGSLQQPTLAFPFPKNQVWFYTGGPHTGWGTGDPFAAVDFAPPSDKSGCFVPKKENFATAMADGLVVRSNLDGLALDLDGDGDERTGWVIFYLHLAADGRAPLGTQLKTGEFIGHPSCVGGHATGTHVHIARKYNGEWIDADGALALNMNGWITHRGKSAYLGTITKGSLTVIACVCGDAYTAISANFP